VNYEKVNNAKTENFYLFKKRFNNLYIPQGKLDLDKDLERYGLDKKYFKKAIVFLKKKNFFTFRLFFKEKNNLKVLIILFYDNTKTKTVKIKYQPVYFKTKWKFI
jgi:hypothetical protein